MELILNQRPYLKTAFISVLILFIFYLINFVVLRNIDRKKGIVSSEKFYLKRKFSQYLRYITIFILLFVWFSQLQVVLVSLVAVAAAVVIATKEMIMCFMGGILLRTSNIFKDGHRIEVNGIRGFVIERTLLTTKVLEIGPEKNSQQTTGDIITFPNSLILVHAVKNESYFKGYSIKSFVFRIDGIKNYMELEKELLSKADDICRDYLKDAIKSISKFCDKEGIFIPTIEPRTKINIDDDHFNLLLKMPVKNNQIADTEQMLNRFYLDWVIQNNKGLES